MALRSLLALVAFVVLLGGCADQRNKAAIEEMDRRHTEVMLIMGGSGGM